MDILAIFVVCTFSGVLTGMLGVGGGLIIVPAFLSIMPFFGIDNLDIHHIVAISATCVFINSATTVFYRRNEEFLPKKFIIKLAIAIMIGTLLGAYYSSFAPAKLIYWIYVVMCLVSLFLIHHKIHIEFKDNRLKPLLYGTFAIIGSVSASIGIGGAVQFATALKVFTGKTTKNLLPSITMLVLIHAFFAFSSKFALGLVTLKIIPIAMISSLIGSKIGIKICEKMTSKAINISMSVVLLLALLRVTMELF